MIVFDIETGPLPEEQLKRIHPPFDRSSFQHPGEFDPSTVKCGNIGGPESEKGKAKIAEARAKHAEECESFASRLAKAESDYWQGITDSAALSSLTGQVLAIAYYGRQIAIHTQRATNEEEMLATFWRNYSNCRESNRKMVGFNIAEFDLPFIAQRSIILGIDIPSTFMNGRYLDSTFVDLRQLWKFGSYSNNRGTLDELCRAMELPGKLDGVTGKDFAKLFANDPEKAIEYAKNDVVITANLAAKFGFRLPDQQPAREAA